MSANYPLIRFTQLSHPKIRLDFALGRHDEKSPRPSVGVTKTCNGKGQPKSRFGCQECKRRHVKCDETYPVCQRCQNRGAVCVMPARKKTWTMELPWLDKPSSSMAGDMATSPRISTVYRNDHSRQLQYWFEQACHIMVLDPEMNPMGLPILKYLNETPSLLHAIQSLSAAHENYYRPHSMEQSLLERQAALSLFQQELNNSRRPPVSAFLTVYTLGISSPWIEDCMGKEHLAGGRVMIEMILASDGLEDELSQFVFGAFIYWDMACSFLLDPQEQQPLNTPQIFNAIQSLGDTYHCIAGYAVEMFYLIGTLGRYCRGVIDGQHRDLVLEATLEEQMISWTPRQDSPMLYSMADVFRKHALIMLYCICHRGVISACNHVDQEADCSDETEHTISRYASEIVQSLGRMPITNPYLNLQSIPLMTAGSELGMDKVELRNEVKQRFKAIYSLNRIPANLRAINLLEELWTLRAAGVKMSWLALLLQKNCLHKFTLG